MRVDFWGNTPPTPALPHPIKQSDLPKIYKNNICFVIARPRVSLHPGPHYTLEGTNFTFPVCHVTGQPAPVVTWEKSSGKLPRGSVQCRNGSLQIPQVRRDDSGKYTCKAENMLGKHEGKTLLLVVSQPQFTLKSPPKVVAHIGDTLILNCSATGDPQPVISWRKQGGELLAGRSQQINGSLVIRGLTTNETGNYDCVATSVGAFTVKAVTYVNVQKLAGKRRAD